jgi:hypothetical protein
MEDVADVEKLLLTVQLQFVQGFGVRLAPKAVELLTMDANDKAQISPPAQNGAKDIVWKSGSCIWSETKRMAVGLT